MEIVFFFEKINILRKTIAMVSNCSLSGPAKCLCSKVEACQFSAGTEVGLLTNVTVETDCRDLCSNNTDCRYYTWYDGSQSLLGLTCLLLSSCARRPKR